MESLKLNRKKSLWAPTAAGPVARLAARSLVFGSTIAFGIVIGSSIGTVVAGSAGKPRDAMATELCTPGDRNATTAPVMLAMMDHSQHDAMSHDEHALHRQMMQREGYTRSAHEYELPDLALRDSDGSDVTLSQILDTEKPVMLNFIYTTCTTICPVLSASFSQVQRDLGQEADRVRMVSISIDPDRDTPRQLREYAKRFGAGPQWRFITGEMDNIVEVQKAFDIYRGAKTNHEPVTLLRASGAKSSWVRIEGIASAQEIISEYHALPTIVQ